MSIHLYKDVLYQLQGLTSLIHLQGVGEPLLNSQLPEMIQIARDYGFSTMTTTNLSFLRYEVLDQLEIVYISLDSTTDWKENPRAGISPPKVVSNLLSLIERPNRPEIHLTTVVSRHNIEQIGSILELAQSQKEKISTVVLSPVIDFTDSGLSLTENDKKTVKAIIDSYPNVAITGPFNSNNHSAQCGWLEDKIYVTIEGFLTPCCIRSSPKQLNFGTLSTSKLITLINNRKLTNFSANLQNKKLDKACSNCNANGSHLLWQEPTD